MVKCRFPNLTIWNDKTVPDHLKYMVHDGKTPVEKPPIGTSEPRQPLREPYAEYVTVRVWAPRHDGIPGHGNPIEHVQAFRTECDGQIAFVLFHPRLGAMRNGTEDGASEIVDAAGNVYDVEEVSETAADWHCIVTKC